MNSTKDSNKINYRNIINSLTELIGEEKRFNFALNVYEVKHSETKVNEKILYSRLKYNINK